jgi:hypothetical protein
VSRKKLNFDLLFGMRSQNHFCFLLFF